MRALQWYWLDILKVSDGRAARILIFPTLDDEYYLLKNTLGFMRGLHSAPSKALRIATAIF